MATSVGADRLDAVLRLAQHTGCGRSWRFGGQALPCGVLVASGGDLDSAYVITTKPIGALDREGTRLVATTPATMSPGMISTKIALNQALSPRTRMYRNAYTYQVAQHASPFDAQAELASMGATDWTYQASQGRMGEAMNGVHTSLTQSYGKDNYTLTPFRIVTSGY